MDTDSDMIFCFGSNQNKPNSLCFGSVSVIFAKLSSNGHGHGHGQWTWPFFFCFGLFRIVFECCGYIETQKQATSILKRNNRTIVLFQIVAKLVSVPVSVISKRNYCSFVGHPSLSTILIVFNSHDPWFNALYKDKSTITPVYIYRWAVN
jgi:hypothetical protein